MLLTADRLGLPPRLAPTDLGGTRRRGARRARPQRRRQVHPGAAARRPAPPGDRSGRPPPALAGPDAGTPPHRWRAPALARRIGSVFQDPEHQFVTGTVLDELALGPRRTGQPEAAVRATVDELLDRLRLDRLAGANPYTLSGGEARRLSVATALATAPRLLICDEPTFGQDRRTWLELVDLLADAARRGARRGHGHPRRRLRRRARRPHVDPGAAVTAATARPADGRRDVGLTAGRPARRRRWPGATRWPSWPPRWSSRCR